MYRHVPNAVRTRLAYVAECRIRRLLPTRAKVVDDDIRRSVAFIRLGRTTMSRVDLRQGHIAIRCSRRRMSIEGPIRDHQGYTFGGIDERRGIQEAG